MRVLVVEDQRDVAELVGRALVRDGHRTEVARSGAQADDLLSKHDFDLAILDLGLPDGDGLIWCRRVRAHGVAFPILVLTSQSAVATRVAGLDAGADDFMPKPFAVAELRARVRALGRRGPIQVAARVCVGAVTLEFDTRRAFHDGNEAPLTSREWQIVELLVSRKGRVMTPGEILDTLWGDDTQAARASLEVIIGRIRKKLGAELIRTIRGEGYAAGAS